MDRWPRPTGRRHSVDVLQQAVDSLREWREVSPDLRLSDAQIADILDRQLDTLQRKISRGRPPRDPYCVPGVDRTASTDDIEKAYRKLARQYHPDRKAGDESATERLAAIESAYEILGDPDKRKEYDRDTARRRANRLPRVYAMGEAEPDDGWINLPPRAVRASRAARDLRHARDLALAQLRLGHNAAPPGPVDLRAANERMKAWPENQERTARGEPLVFLCQCGRRRCPARVELTGAQYEPARADTALFVIAPGHEFADAEDVIEEHEAYVVVRKHYANDP